MRRGVATRRKGREEEGEEAVKRSTALPPHEQRRLAELFRDGGSMCVCMGGWGRGVHFEGWEGAKSL